MADQPAQPHDNTTNNPPADADPLIDRLREKYETLADEQADLELEVAMLPREVKSDDDVIKVNAVIKKMKDVAKRAEAARKEEKDDYLRAGQKIDGFFKKDITDPIAERVKALEARNTPYLTAKAAAEEARKRAEAEAIRKAQEEAAAREAAEREAEAKARAEAAEAERKIREAADEDARAAAAEELRQKEAAAAASAKAAEQAVKDQAAAERSAGARERAAESGKTALSRTGVAGQGSATLAKEWKHRITDSTKLYETLGPLGGYLSGDAVGDALRRAAKAQKEARFDIPGVEFYEETSAKTR